MTSPPRILRGGARRHQRHVLGCPLAPRPRAGHGSTLYVSVSVLVAVFSPVSPQAFSSHHPDRRRHRSDPVRHHAFLLSGRAAPNAALFGPGFRATPAQQGPGDQGKCVADAGGGCSPGEGGKGAMRCPSMESEGVEARPVSPPPLPLPSGTHSHSAHTVQQPSLDGKGRRRDVLVGQDEQEGGGAGGKGDRGGD